MEQFKAITRMYFGEAAGQDNQLVELVAGEIARTIDLVRPLIVCQSQLKKTKADYEDALKRINELLGINENQAISIETQQDELKTLRTKGFNNSTEILTLKNQIRNYKSETSILNNQIKEYERYSRGLKLELDDLKGNLKVAYPEKEVVIKGEFVDDTQDTSQSNKAMGQALKIAEVMIDQNGGNPQATVRKAESLVAGWREDLMQSTSHADRIDELVTTIALYEGEVIPHLVSLQTGQE